MPLATHRPRAHNQRTPPITSIKHCQGLPAQPASQQKPDLAAQGVLPFLRSPDLPAQPPKAPRRRGANRRGLINDDLSSHLPHLSGPGRRASTLNHIHHTASMCPHITPFIVRASQTAILSMLVDLLALPSIVEPRPHLSNAPPAALTPPSQPFDPFSAVSTKTIRTVYYGGRMKGQRPLFARQDDGMYSTEQI